MMFHLYNGFNIFKLVIYVIVQKLLYLVKDNLFQFKNGFKIYLVKLYIFRHKYLKLYCKKQNYVGLSSKIPIKK